MRRQRASYKRNGKIIPAELSRAKSLWRSHFPAIAMMVSVRVSVAEPYRQSPYEIPTDIPLRKVFAGAKDEK